MSFLKDPIVSNILTIISVLITSVSLIRDIIKEKSSKGQSQVISIHIQGYFVQGTCQPKQKSSSSNEDAIKATLALAIFGGMLYPYRQEMAVVFSLFWWVVVVVQTRFSKKALVTPRGYNLLRPILLEVAADIAVILLLDSIPAELYLGLRFMEKIFPSLMAGLLSIAYAFLFFLGILILVFSLSDAKSKPSIWSAKMLYKLWWRPTAFILLAAIPIMVLWLFHIAGIG